MKDLLLTALSLWKEYHEERAMFRANESLYRLHMQNKRTEAELNRHN